MKERSRGFSLLELMLAIGLAALILVAAVVNLRRGVGGASSRALAESVAEELREAHKLAIASQVPVAVGFPSSNGADPHFQALYRIQEENKPVLTFVRNYATEFPGSYLFAGSWGASGETATQPTPVSNGDSLDLSGWANPVSSQDPLLIFTPSGTVRSNGLPVYGGDFHLAVGSGVQYSGGTAGDWMSFHLSRIADPQMVTITPTGQVSVTGGLPGATGVTEEIRPFLAAPGAAPPSLAATANNTPTIDSLLVAPSAAGASPGTATVPEGGHLTLTVLANDPDCERLYCSWAGPGSFSSANQDRSEWDPARSAWVSVWEWRPPEGDPVGTTYTLTATVRDQRGAAVSGGGQGQLSVTSASSAQVVYSGITSGGRPAIGVVGINGVNEHWILYPDSGCGELALSPDGQRIAYVRGDGGLYVANLDGSGETKIAASAAVSGASRPLAWSPDGSVITYASNNYKIWTINADGTGNAMFANKVLAFDPMFSPDGRWILFSAYDGNVANQNDIFMKQFPSGAEINLSALLPSGQANHQFLIDCQAHLGRWRLLYGDQPTTLVHRLVELDPTTLPAPVLTDIPLGIAGPVWGNGSHSLYQKLSPDGSQLAYTTWSYNINCLDLDSGTNYASTTNQQIASFPIWSRDSSTLIFRTDHDHIPNFAEYDLSAVPAHGGAVIRLTRDQRGSGGAWDCTPR